MKKTSLWRNGFRFSGILSGMKHVAYLSLGSNTGDPGAALAGAVDRLRRGGGVRVVEVSGVYRTSPVGKTDQPDFLNSAVKIETELEPRSLLEYCKAIEADMGRNIKDGRWEPRPMDIDIVFYDDLTLKSPDLEIPHPRFRERLFVLVPLLEIAPDLKAPDGAPLADILKRGKNKVFEGQGIEKLSK